MIAGLVFFVAYAAVAFKILAVAEVQSDASPPVKESLQRVCVTCHALEQITSSRRSRSQWDDLINRMIERGAKGTDEEFTLVFDYLVRQYGRVNVNTARPTRWRRFWVCRRRRLNPSSRTDRPMVDLMASMPS